MQITHLFWEKVYAASAVVYQYYYLQDHIAFLLFAMFAHIEGIHVIQ